MRLGAIELNCSNKLSLAGNSQKVHYNTMQFLDTHLWLGFPKIFFELLFNFRVAGIRIVIQALLGLILPAAYPI